MELRRRSLILALLRAVLLWAGFWLLGAAAVLSLLAVPLFQLSTGGPRWSGAFAGALALMLLWALRPRLIPEISEGEAQGRRPLTRDEVPELFALLDEAAGRAGVPAPEVLHLGDHYTAVTLVQRKRTVVGLGFPLFALLSREELAAVVAHELGHHRSGDLILGAWVHRTRRALAHTLEALESAGLFLDLPFSLYASWFMKISSAVSRQQELDADAWSARSCGVRAARGALFKLQHHADHWDVYFDRVLRPAIAHGARMPILEGFRRFRAQARWSEEVVRCLEPRTPQPFDTHPPVEERLRALGPGAVDESDANCLQLLGGPEEAEVLWYRLAVPEEPLERLDWDRLASLKILPALDEAFSETRIDPDRVGPEALPELVTRAEALWDELRPGINVLSPAAQRLRGLKLLEQWLAAALVARGWTAELEPGGELRLRNGDRLLEPAEWVRKLASGHSPAEEFRRLVA
jgi:Zn-dependent protease with chaperone function